MTLDQLEMLEAIIQEGSMQKAAKRLHKSQPSLSVGIKKIEGLYNIKLFSRETYRPTLTNEGEIFYQNAQQVLFSQRKLHKVATELGADIEPKIYMVIDPIVLLSRLDDLFKVALSKIDTTQIIITEDVIEKPMEALINKTADFAVGHCPPGRAHEVEKKKLGRLELVPVVKRGLNYKELPNIVVTKKTGREDTHTRRGAAWYVSSHGRKEELILAGFGWGRMSRLKVKEMSDQLSVIKSIDHKKVDLDVYLMKNKDAPLGRVGRQLWGAMN